jgi:uncharacterized protein (DUF488 family)
VKFVTIGVYGFSAEGFFQALQEAGVDVLCDIRWRRGVRGKEYSFANSARLQKRLTELGIRYVHVRDVAPNPALRKRQHDADDAEGIAKRKRTALTSTFIEGYREDILSKFDSGSFLGQLGPEPKTVALLCVEREPGACHRSLLAARLQQDLATGTGVVNLTPKETLP